MLRGFEGKKRIIQPLTLPVSPRLPPTGGVTSDAINELVVPDILRALVRILAMGGWSPDQGQADTVIVRLVGPNFAIGEDGGAKLAAHVGQVDPLMRRHFVISPFCSRPLGSADVPV